MIISIKFVKILCLNYSWNLVFFTSSDSVLITLESFIDIPRISIWPLVKPHADYCSRLSDGFEKIGKCLSNLWQIFGKKILKMGMFFAILLFRCSMFFSIHILSIHLNFQTLTVIKLFVLMGIKSELNDFFDSYLKTRCRLFQFNDLVYYRTIALHQTPTTRKARNAKMFHTNSATGRKSLICFVSYALEKTSGTINYLKKRLLQNYMLWRKPSQATKKLQGPHMAHAIAL